MSQIGIVILGASVYDHHADLANERFLTSANAFLEAVRETAILGGGKPVILNLYNRQYSPHTIIRRVVDFVKKPLKDIVIYYCGHGVIPRGRKGYSVYLRTTQLEMLNSTALGVRELAQDMEHFLVGKRVFVVLDACYSGEAIRELMDATAATSLIDVYLRDSLPNAGMAYAAASEPSDAARVLTADTMTLFTGAFVSTLRAGISSRGNSRTLSWRDVNDEVVNRVRQRLGQEAPIPRLVAIHAKEGDITTMPFFTNLAYQPSSERLGGLDEETIEHAQWEFIDKRSNLDHLESFLARFPNGNYSQLAVARMQEIIGGETHVSVLQKFVGDHPSSRVLTSARTRLEILLEWEKIDKSPVHNESPQALHERIAALRSFIEQFPQAAETSLAQAAIVSLEWHALRDICEIADFERFIVQYPNCPHAAEARHRLGELTEAAAAKAAAARVPDPPAAQDVHQQAETADLSSPERKARRNWFEAVRGVTKRWASAAAAIVLLVGIGGLALAVSGGWISTGDSEQAKRQALAALEEQVYRAAAGAGDMVRLQRYVDGCVVCQFKADAISAITKRQQQDEDRENFRLAGNDPEKLRDFLRDCRLRACAQAQEAQASLDRIEAERKRLEVAGNDRTKLAALLLECRTEPCVYAKQAQDRFDRIEADGKRMEAERAEAARKSAEAQRIDAERRRLDADRAEAERKRVQAERAEAERKRVEAERAEAERKRVETERAETERRRAEAERAEAERRRVVEAQRAEAERKRIEAQRAEAERKRVEAEQGRFNLALNDPVKLRSYLNDCRTQTCVYAQQAEDRLRRLEFVDYRFHDLPGGDLAKLPQVDLSRCVSECRSRDDCKAYTYDNWNRHCTLKSTVTRLLLLPKATTAIRKDQLHPGWLESAKRFCYYNGTFPGAGVDTNAFSRNQCENNCRDRSSCLGFTYFPAANRCRLFDDPPEYNRDDAGKSGVRTQLDPC